MSLKTPETLSVSAEVCLISAMVLRLSSTTTEALSSSSPPPTWRSGAKLWWSSGLPSSHSHAGRRHAAQAGAT